MYTSKHGHTYDRRTKVRPEHVLEDSLTAQYLANDYLRVTLLGDVSMYTLVCFARGYPLVTVEAVYQAWCIITKRIDALVKFD